MSPEQYPRDVDAGDGSQEEPTEQDRAISGATAEFDGHRPQIDPLADDATTDRWLRLKAGEAELEERRATAEREHELKLLQARSTVRIAEGAAHGQENRRTLVTAGFWLAIVLVAASLVIRVAASATKRVGLPHQHGAWGIAEAASAALAAAVPWLAKRLFLRRARISRAPADQEADALTRPVPPGDVTG